MLGQVNLRFQKETIARLKRRAEKEQVSANSLAERFVRNGLDAPAPDDAWLRLVEAPDETVMQLWHQIVAGETFGNRAPGRAELRFICESVHQAYTATNAALVSLDMLDTLLDITGELLLWQAESGEAIDSHYIRNTLGFNSDDWATELDRLRADRRSGTWSGDAEMLLRPLASGCFPTERIPDEVLARVFTQSRLRTLFPLVVRARDWSPDATRSFIQSLRPHITAQREYFPAGNLTFEVHVLGTDARLVRPGIWYEPPRLFLVVGDDNFTLPFDWPVFADMVRVLRHHIQAAERLYAQSQHVSLMAHATLPTQAILQLDTLRLQIPADALNALADQLTHAVDCGSLSAAFSALRSLYGDI